MAFDPRREVSRRIERAMREYAKPDSDVTVYDLEDEIERAFKMEYEYEELPRFAGGAPVQSWSLNTDQRVRRMKILGMNVEPGETVRFDRVMDPPEPFEIEIDPWDDDEDEYWGQFWHRRIVDGLLTTCIKIKDNHFSRPPWDDRKI